MRREWLVLALALCVETSLSGEKTSSVLACPARQKVSRPLSLASHLWEKKIKAEQSKAKSVHDPRHSSFSLAGGRLGELRRWFEVAAREDVQSLRRASLVRIRTHIDVIRTKCMSFIIFRLRDDGLVGVGTFGRGRS